MKKKDLNGCLKIQYLEIGNKIIMIQPCNVLKKIGKDAKYLNL